MRGMEVIDTGAPLSVPVGGATLGRIFNVLGAIYPYMYSPTQYIHSPFGETEAATKSPPSRLPDEKHFTTCNKFSRQEITIRIHGNAQH